MKIVILDEMKKRSDEMMQILEKKNHRVVACTTSNDFMKSAGETSCDKLLVDCESWRKGRSVYSYFTMDKKFEAIPIVFYNAPERFSGIGERVQLEQDVVLVAPTEIDDIIGAVSGN